MDSYRGFGVTMVEDDNIEIQDENGQPVIAKGYYCQIYADFDCNMEIDSFLICTPKVRHIWRCIFLWAKQEEKTKRTRQNSKSML